MGGQVNIGGVWKDIASVSVNIGGAWKTASSIKCNIGGVWKDGWSVELEYGADFTGSKTYSADSYASAGNEADKAFDDSEATTWVSANTAFPHWLKVDLGAGVTKTANKLRVCSRNIGGLRLKNFILKGSNNNTDWTDIYTGITTNTTGWQEFTFSNATAYRYYQLYATDNWPGNNYCDIIEMELMELAS
jgi:hypothetical protein